MEHQPLMGTGWMLVAVHTCKARGHLWHGTALQFLPQYPESTNAASPIPWLVGEGEKYTSTCYAPTQNDPLSSPWEDPGELSQVTFGLVCFLVGLKDTDLPAHPTRALQSGLRRSQSMRYAILLSKALWIFQSNRIY